MMNQLQQYTDQQIIQCYKEGNENILQELITRYHSKIFRTIYMRVKDEHLAEDIFQETFIKVIHTIKSGGYNEEGKFLPWVIRIAHNLVIDHFRTQQRKSIIVNNDAGDLLETLPILEEDVERSLMKDQSFDDLKKLIKLLPDEQKEVLIMRHFCDMSFKDIAKITQVSINTALGRMRYALNNLRRMIEDHKLTFQFN